MYDKKIIVIVVLSGMLTMSFLLFSISTTSTIHQQEASSLFYENLFGSSNNAYAQQTPNINPSNTPATTASLKQTGTPGDDNIRGGDENDVLVGLAGNDIIVGQAGNDNIDGSEGNDYLIGSPGNDSLAGGAGIDILEGNAGNDNIYGSEGNDYLIGGQGADTLKGVAGNDTLIGGPGADILAGGLGQDKFICGPGKDTMLDFNATEEDSRTIDCETATAATASPTATDDDITDE